MSERKNTNSSLPLYARYITSSGDLSYAELEGFRVSEKPKQIISLLDLVHIRNKQEMYKEEVSNEMVILKTNHSLTNPLL